MKRLIAPTISGMMPTANTTCATAAGVATSAHQSTSPTQNVTTTDAARLGNIVNSTVRRAAGNRSTTPSLRERRKQIWGI